MIDGFVDRARRGRRLLDRCVLRVPRVDRCLVHLVGVIEVAIGARDERVEYSG
jgi:hypothetical protein